MDTSLEKNVRLFHGDCLVGLSRVETGSVDLVLCDLPYGTTACAWDTVIPFEPLWEQYRRIVKPKGALVFRYDLIWEKNSPVGFANSHRQPLRSHEQILVFYMRQPTYNPQGLVKLEKPIVRQGGKTSSVYRSMSGASVQQYTNYPRSVLHYPNRGEKRYHPTQKPVALLEYLICTYTNPGALVVDNCMGGGSTVVACLNTGRRCMGFEKDKGIYETACQRVRARAAELSIA